VTGHTTQQKQAQDCCVFHRVFEIFLRARLLRKSPVFSNIVARTNVAPGRRFQQHCCAQDCCANRKLLRARLLRKSTGFGNIVARTFRLISTQPLGVATRRDHQVDSPPEKTFR
jgi:hypothetical protein